MLLPYINPENEPNDETGCSQYGGLKVRYLYLLLFIFIFIGQLNEITLSFVRGIGLGCAKTQTVARLKLRGAAQVGFQSHYIVSHVFWLPIRRMSGQ